MEKALICSDCLDCQAIASLAAGIVKEKSLRNKAHQWWYFLDHPHIPPDNNLAERF